MALKYIYIYNLVKFLHKFNLIIIANISLLAVIT